MERKFITDELIKVANALDEMGLNKEANSLDKIARKIVVSENPSIYSRNYIKFQSTGGPEKMSQRTGRYADDIANYKRLYNAASYDDDGKKDIDQELLQLATNLYNSVVGAWFNNPYTPEQRKAFKDQAARIRTDIDSGSQDINYSNKTKTRKHSFNDILVHYGITDYNGNLDPNIKSKQQLRSLIMKMQSEWDQKKWGNAGLFPRQFTNTFNLLGRKLPETEPAVESLDV
jgi:hypothetical protein